MENNEYIEFEIYNTARFNDLVKLFNQISEAKKSSDYKTNEYWFEKFPNYTLKHYYFAKSDLKPKFQTSKLDNNTWHFYSMTEYLVENIDVEFLECKAIKKKGRLEFYSNGYPYGGITGLIMFIKSFGFKPIKTDDGTGIYEIKWINETKFELKTIEPTPNNNYSLILYIHICIATKTYN